MLPRNKNENISSLNSGSGVGGISRNIEEGERGLISSHRQYSTTTSNRSSTTTASINSNVSNKSDNLNNNKNNIPKTLNTTSSNNKSKRIPSYSFINSVLNNDHDDDVDSDIVNDFDLVARISNYKNIITNNTPLTPTTPATPTTFKSLNAANSNNPTETIQLNPILNVTNQMSEISSTFKHSTNTNTNTNTNSISNSNNKGKLIEATTTVTPTTGGGIIGGTTTNNMKTLNGSPSHLRQNSISSSNNIITTSSSSTTPNTPESLRKQQLLLRHRGSDTIMSGTNNLIMNSSHPPPTSAKKDKMEFNQMMMRMNYEKESNNSRPLSYHGKSTTTSTSTDSSYPNSIVSSPVNKRHVGSPSAMNGRNNRKESTLLNRRSMPSPYLENRLREKFDLSELDTNLPRIDLEAIENHLRVAREEERKRRTDREEIRRRLALESDEINDKPGGRKPSLHSRLQSSMNLQICFMNETASDSESPGSDNEVKNSQPPASLPCEGVMNKVQSGKVMEGNGISSGGISSEDFYTRQARLQADARRALSQAKDLARLQMTQEKERRFQSPITEMVRNSLHKVGVTLSNEKKRVSRQLLTELNVAQLQVIVNDLHSHIEVLNETLVSMLLERDDLHMEQDSMLVDIEDLTRYLAAKDNSPHQSLPLIQPNLLGKK